MNQSEQMRDVFGSETKNLSLTSSFKNVSTTF